MLNAANQEHYEEALRYHLAGAARAAAELDLVPVVRSLRRLRVLAPEAPEPVPEPVRAEPIGPELITDPIEKRSIKQQAERMSNDATIFYR